MTDDGQQMSDAEVVYVLMGVAVDACARVLDDLASERVLRGAVMAAMRVHLDELRHLRTQVLADEVELRGAPQILLGFVIDAAGVADLLSEDELMACREVKSNIDRMVQQ